MILNGLGVIQNVNVTLERPPAVAAGVGIGRLGIGKIEVCAVPSRVGKRNVAVAVDLLNYRNVSARAVSPARDGAELRGLAVFIEVISLVVAVPLAGAVPRKLGLFA